MPGLLRLTAATILSSSAPFITDIHASAPAIGSNQPIHEREHLHRGVLVIVVVGALLLGCLLCTLVLLYLLHRKRACAASTSCLPNKEYSHQATEPAGEGISVQSVGFRLKPSLGSFHINIGRRRPGSVCVFDYAHLQAATNNFSTDNLLGRGGSGCVFKAHLDENFFAAVKLLSPLDDKSIIEKNFKAEVELMSGVRHPNLVSLLGYSIHGSQRFLVYELMQNRSLEDQLHGHARGSALTWNLRMKIAFDAARGLEYLHEHCNPAVIHRDFKSSNILLDASFNAKVADFGLAILLSDFMDGKNIQLQGTLGYVAPEYLLDGSLSEKSDVYAFGVVLLELITGRKPIDMSMPVGCESLVTWAAKQLTDRSKMIDLLDSQLHSDSVNLKHLYQVAAIAAVCIQQEPSYRPLITDVVHSLSPLVPVELGGVLRSGGVPDKQSSCDKYHYHDHHSSFRDDVLTGYDDDGNEMSRSSSFSTRSDIDHLCVTRSFSSDNVLESNLKHTQLSMSARITRYAESFSSRSADWQ